MKSRENYEECMEVTAFYIYLSHIIRRLGTSNAQGNLLCSNLMPLDDS